MAEIVFLFCFFAAVAADVLLLRGTTFDLPSFRRPQSPNVSKRKFVDENIDRLNLVTRRKFHHDRTNVFKDLASGS